MGMTILIIFVLAIAGAIVWFFLKNKKEEPSVQPEKPSEPVSQPSATPVDEVPKEEEKGSEKPKEEEFKPKFKVGDFVKHGYYPDNTYMVKSVDLSGDYELDSVDGEKGKHITKATEDVIRLWDVSEDAKAGDVLYLQHDGKEHIIIYKGVIKERFRTFVSAYCAYNGIVDAFCFADVSRYIDIAYGGIMPATNEQRDFLFQKMKEASYEWDAEKKELKKIEDAPKPPVVEEKPKYDEEYESYIGKYSKFAKIERDSSTYKWF